MEGGREKSKGRRDGWSVDDICDCLIEKRGAFSAKYEFSISGTRG